MEFFKSNDWFGRSGSFLYSTEHIIFVVLAMALCIVVPILLRKKSEKAIFITFLCVWIFQVLLDGTKFIVNWSDGIGLDWELPLYTCTMPMLLMPFVLWCKNEKIRNSVCNYICTIGLLSGMINFFYTGVLESYSIFSFMGLHTCIYHGILIFYALTLLITGSYKPKFKDMLGGLIVFGCTILPTIILDYALNLDYMYFRTAYCLPVLEDVAASMPTFVWTICMILIYVFIMALFNGIIIGSKKLFCKPKTQQKTE